MFPYFRIYPSSKHTGISDLKFKITEVKQVERNNQRECFFHNEIKATGDTTITQEDQFWKVNEERGRRE